MSTYKYVFTSCLFICGIFLTTHLKATTLVSSILEDGLDSDYAISTQLLPNNPSEINATKSAKVFRAKQQGKISTPYVIPPAYPELKQTWYNTPRNYWVYTPHNYQMGDQANLLLVLDGQRMEKELNLAAMLDYLIEQKQIPPTIMVLLHTGRGQGRDGDDRRFEMMRTNAEWSNYVVEHVLKNVSKNYSYSQNSQYWAVLGSSSSAVGAFSLAWYKPNLFNRVIALSGSFVSLRVERANTWVNAHQFSELVSNSSRQDLRVYLSTGFADLTDSDGPKNQIFTWAQVNTQLAEALQAKGHKWRYFFRQNHGHNSDYSRPQIEQIFKWIWEGAPIETQKISTK